MAKQDLRKMKNQKQTVDKDAIKQAENIMGKDINISDKDMNNINQMADMAKKYEGKSEDELKRELFKMTEQGRKDGSLNNEMLDNFYRSMTPVMNREQRQKLESLMKMLKK